MIAQKNIRIGGRDLPENLESGFSLPGGPGKANRTSIPLCVQRPHAEEEIVLGKVLHRVTRDLADDPRISPNG